MATNFFAGTSGLLTPIPKRDFPPQHQDKSRLAYYATLFNSIEINSSFYKLPKTATVAKWADEVTPNFTFTYKLWKEVTHNKGMAFNPEHIKQFIDVINHAGDHRGCLLVQFPPSITVANAIQLENLLSTIKNLDDQWKLVVEFRHSSWYQENIYELLEKYSSSFVLHDMPASAAPLQPLADDLVYVRFHGPGGKYGGSYDDDILYEYALYIKEWQEEGKTVYVYFNNTAGDALNNLLTLQKLVSAR
jgi:uncharacterized protein YecE (DUF72 family)